MKMYEITIKPEIFTNDFPTINRIICVKRIDPISIFKAYYNLEVKSITKIGKNVWYIKAGYEIFSLTVFSFTKEKLS